MNFIASPPGAFGLLTTCMLSSFIAGNLINNGEIPKTGTIIWIVLCAIGLFLLILLNSPIGLPVSFSIFIYLIIVSSLCTGSGFIYFLFKK